MHLIVVSAGVRQCGFGKLQLHRGWNGIAFSLAEGHQSPGPLDINLPSPIPLDTNNQNNNDAEGPISEQAEAMGNWQSCDRPMVISIDLMRVGHGNVNESTGLGGSHTSDRQLIQLEVVEPVSSEPPTSCRHTLYGLINR